MTDSDMEEIPWFFLDPKASATPIREHPAKQADRHLWREWRQRLTRESNNS